MSLFAGHVLVSSAGNSNGNENPDKKVEFGLCLRPYININFCFEFCSFSSLLLPFELPAEEASYTY